MGGLIQRLFLASYTCGLCCLALGNETQAVPVDNWIKSMEAARPEDRSLVFSSPPHTDISSDAAIESLIKGCNHKDAYVRRSVVAALGDVGKRSERVVPTLMSAFKDPDLKVRQFALCSLVRLGQPAVGPLANALTDLGTVDTRWFGTYSQTTARTADYAAFALSVTDSPVIASLFDVFRREQAIERQRPIAMQTTSNDSASPQRTGAGLANAGRPQLTDESQYVHCSAQYLADEIILIVIARGSRSADARDLVPLLSDSDQVVKSLALRAQAAVKGKNPQARTPFASAPVRVRPAAGMPRPASHAKNEPPPTSRQTLILRYANSLGDSNLGVAQAAASSLASLVRSTDPGLTPIVPKLIKAVRSGDGRLQSKAADALRVLGPQARDALPTLLDGLSVSPPFVVGKDLGQSAQLKFVSALGTVGQGDKKTISLLETILTDRSRQSLQEQAATSLAQAAGRQSVPALCQFARQALRDTRSGTSQTALNALVRIEPEGVKTLFQITNDATLPVATRLRVCNFLAANMAQGESVTAGLMEALNSSEPQIRIAAAEALARRGLNGSQVIPTMLAAFRSAPADARMLDAIASYQAEGETALIDLLQADYGAPVRVLARQALESIQAKDPRLVPLVSSLRILDDQDVARRALLIPRIAAAHDSEKAGQILIPLLDDPNPIIRRATAASLVRLRPKNTTAAINPLVEMLIRELRPDVDLNPRNWRTTPAGAAFDALQHFGRRAEFASDRLLPFIRHANPEVRRRIVNVLQSSGRRDSLTRAALGGALRDSDPGVCEAAANAILSIGTNKPTLLTDVAHVAASEYIDRALKTSVDRFADECRPPLDFPESDRGAELPPALPWPPPQWSRMAKFGDEDIPRELLGSDDTTLGAICDKLDRSLQAVDQGFESGVFTVPGGFAMLARLERIAADGSPLGGENHWAYGELRPMSLSDYIGRLFLEKPGYFRILAFVITSEPILHHGDGTLPSPSSGWAGLPDALRVEKFKNKTAYVLVYSYERSAGGQFSSFDALSAKVHLEKSGVLAVIGHE
jgi:HEAT repeat protein